jgi:hypothetical protein
LWKFFCQNRATESEKLFNILDTAQNQLKTNNRLIQLAVESLKWHNYKLYSCMLITLPMCIQTVSSCCGVTVR